jgi:hypothetical protein
MRYKVMERGGNRERLKKGLWGKEGSENIELGHYLLVVVMGF